MKTIDLLSRGRNVVISRYDDGSVLLQTYDEDGRRTGVPLTSAQDKKLAEFFSEGSITYVVKSHFNCYATISEPYEGGILPTLDWTKDRKKAVRFASKASAKALAALCELADARAVRVRMKRRG